MSTVRDHFIHMAKLHQSDAEWHSQDAEQNFAMLSIFKDSDRIVNRTKEAMVGSQTNSARQYALARGYLMALINNPSIED